MSFEWEQIKDLDILCVFFQGAQFKRLSPEMMDRINTGELIVTKYVDTPLFEAIYIETASKNN